MYFLKIVCRDNMIGEGVSYSTDPAQDSDKWRILLNTVIDL
jgi:hypothetical protein